MITYILLGLILIFGIIIALGLSVFRAIYHFIFGKSSKSSNRQQEQRRFHEDHNSSQHTRREPQSNGKIFGKDEGEYVDFEEIKD